MRTADIHRLADEELIVLVRDRNPDAFEVIYDRHGGAAYSLAYRIAGDRGVAEDITQEAFASIWRSGGRYDRERGSVRTWMLGIVHHRAIDALRRNTAHDRHRASAEGIEERHEAPDRTDVEAARRHEAREVREALETLPARQLEVVLLAYFGGFTHTQIAQILDEPVGTVKGRMRLGLEKMRRALTGGELAT
jgi:RNA polymerase sigma-70 factor, ECF subfamily